MSILYVTDQGASLVKRGNRLLVQKRGETVHWVHASKVDQLILMGNISISPGALSCLLQQGTDTVFMSIHGKYRGRLVSTFGKNIDLRRSQFRKMEDESVRLTFAKAFIQGKPDNCRTLLRRHNTEGSLSDVTSALHKIRLASRKTTAVESLESLMGLEGQSAAAYFGCFGGLIKAEGMIFSGRSRRPPRDPVNVLLSLGYTLLANVLQTQVNVVGLDPYVGCLHGVEYGRPSLVLDLMEEFRPVLVDSVVLTVINKQIIKVTDFYRPEEKEPAAFDFAEDPVKEGYPILLDHVGMKKFITHFENRLNQRVLYLGQGKRLTYRDICLEQVRLFARCLQDEQMYKPFTIR